MEKRLLVLDLDGTLTNSQKKVTPATKEAILKMMDRGHVCMLASGRSTPGVRPIAEELKFPKRGGYILSFNGAKIIDCLTNEVLYQQTLSLEWLPTLLKFARENHCGLITYTEDEIISANGIDEYIQLESRVADIPIKEVKDFPGYVTFPINKCLMTAHPDHAAKCEVLLRDLVGEHISVYRSDPYYIEIVPKGIDKAASLEKMLPIIGISRENCIACGDGFNDIGMIKFAGIGVAMGNAQQVVKDAADVITLTNDEDGIIPIIEKYFL